MAYVEKYIEAYPTKKFLELTPREQNNILKKNFSQKNPATVFKAKNRYINKLVSRPHETKQDNKPQLDNSIPSHPIATNKPQLAISIDEIDISSLDANQQTLFKIAWNQYITEPTPQWFNVLMSFLEKTHQLKTNENEEWQQMKQLTNNELISLIKPEKSSLPDTGKPLLKNTAKH